MPAAKKKPEPYEIKVVGSFMSDPVPEDKAAEWIPVAEIGLPEKQPRKFFDPQKMEQLIASVKEKGVLEPLLIRPKEEGGYELVAGERRLRAAKANNLEKVRCVVQDLSDKDTIEIALLENLQRDDLNPVEETEAILDLLSVKLDKPRKVIIGYFNLVAHSDHQNDAQANNPDWQTITKIFDVIGRFTPNSFRTNRLPLLKLPEEVFEAIANGKIEYSKARLIARVKDGEKRQSILKIAITEALSQREIQQRIKELKTQGKSKTPASEIITQMSSVYRQVSKSKAWEDSNKRKKLEHHLSEIKKLMSE